MKIVVTGASGLIGWHATTRLHAANRASNLVNDALPFEIVALDHASFNDSAYLDNAISGSDAILHFAGINRDTDEVVKAGNPSIARRLAEACISTDANPHIVYANSIHATSNTIYGASKRIAGEILQELNGRFTDLTLPHIFGECARPNYNNVTATFVDKIIAGEVPNIDLDGSVDLTYAGEAAQIAIDAVLNARYGSIKPMSERISIPDLYAMLQTFHSDYAKNIFPDLKISTTLNLFNSYRSALYPKSFPRPLDIRSDDRGQLFEAVKGGGGGQTFLSTTMPGITRGNHFHLQKVERFLVVQGEAKIRIRRLMDREVWTYQVSGDSPAAVDIPTLHTHSIENVGSGPLLTMFWTHDLYNEKYPDTFDEPV